MSNQLQVIIKEQGIEIDDAKKLVEAFGGPFDEAGEILANYESIKVTEEDDLKGMKIAREQRLILKKARTTVENKRKELKADIVKQGRAIDSVAKFVKEQIEPAEKYLELQEQYAGIKAAERAAAKKAERIESLSKYVEDISVYNLDVTDEQFETIIAGAKSQYEGKIAEEKRLEEERIAKEKAESEEREKIRLENERLKEEAEAREAELEKERKQREAEEAKRLEAERAERERIQAEAQAKLDEERQQREKLEAEVKAKEEGERAERERAEKAEQEARNASDSVKLERFSEAIEIIRREKMPVVSQENRYIIEQIDAKFQDIQNIIKEGL